MILSMKYTECPMTPLTNTVIDTHVDYLTFFTLLNNALKQPGPP